jgi:hypothetical protein
LFSPVRKVRKFHLSCGNKNGNISFDRPRLALLLWGLHISSSRSG